MQPFVASLISLSIRVGPTIGFRSGIFAKVVQTGPGLPTRSFDSLYANNDWGEGGGKRATADARCRKLVQTMFRKRSTKRKWRRLQNRNDDGGVRGMRGVKSENDDGRIRDCARLKRTVYVSRTRDDDGDGDVGHTTRVFTANPVTSADSVVVAATAVVNEHRSPQSTFTAQTPRNDWSPFIHGTCCATVS